MVEASDKNFVKSPYARTLLEPAALLKLASHSAYPLPAPKPRPIHAGNALRLNKRTEKTMPNPRPRPDFMMALERQRSHLSLRRVSETGADTRLTTCDEEVDGVEVSGVPVVVVIVAD